ncbi:unnamed protein product [Rodentolepis nana]|uniref:Mediator of RNA polymerase II transcription subunit 23 n=1 Tax=Rodentolepis nana TaxID=102285 RepID=A0A0R3TZ93_RODNA|nr:unnamed protein product [Rodentolepis nana]
MLQLESMIATMVIRIWLRALTQHYPSNPYWEGLQELCRVSRHRIGPNYIWSRVMVVFTFNLLRPHISQDLSSPPSIHLANMDKVAALVDAPPFTAFQPLMGRQLTSNLPPKVLELSWFRLLNIFENPVDLCHPSEITHTAVFEYFRQLNLASRYRLTAVFLPAIFFHMMRSFSTVVDIFLGISPSLAGSLSTFIGVPQDLFGPLTDVAEYFQYTSVRSPDTVIWEKPRGSIDNNTSTSDLPVRADSAPMASTVSVTSLANLVRNAGLSSNVDPQSLAEAWLRPDLLVTCFYNRPKASSFIQLLGSWLFEAASGKSTVSNASGKKGAIVSERALKVDNISFHVGRAEAMACLCRIFIYARKTQLTFSGLARFYVCLVNALTVDAEVEYVLSTVLFHSPDLLRADLPGSFSLLAVPLFNAALWILKKPSIVCPEYVSMVLLRRASLHQLLSMTCLPNHLKGVQFQDLSSPGSVELASLSTRDLRTKLAGLLCDFLGYETDTHNLRMLLNITLQPNCHGY